MRSFVAAAILFLAYAGWVYLAFSLVFLSSAPLAIKIVLGLFFLVTFPVLICILFYRIREGMKDRHKQRKKD